MAHHQYQPCLRNYFSVDALDSKSTARKGVRVRVSGVAPSLPTKSLTEILRRKFIFHDLRHSYARHLCNSGVNLKLVSECLGNSQSVCEKYYAGWISEDMVLGSLAKLLG